jgi:hypothetical protein
MVLNIISFLILIAASVPVQAQTSRSELATSQHSSTIKVGSYIWNKNLCVQTSQSGSSKIVPLSVVKAGKGCPQLRDYSLVERAYSAQQVQSSSLTNLLISKYRYLDPENVVPKDLLAKAVTLYDHTQDQLRNPNFITVVDFSKPSSAARFFLIDMRTGGVEALRVAHGQGSDPNKDGYAERFSNNDSSHESSLGVYVTLGTYSGKHGYSLKLDGLSPTNRNAKERAIVVHGANYVRNKDVVQGRSWGCLALARESSTPVINAIKGGSLIYVGLSKSS